MARTILIGLDPKEYEHPLDTEARNALESYKLLETVVRKFNQYGVEKILRVRYTGSNLRVTDRCFPEVMAALREACENLSVEPVPTLYVRWGYHVNAFTAGVEEPIVVIDSGCVDLLSYEELLFVFGHEVGHIKSRHVLYHQMAQVLPFLGEILGAATLGVGKLFSAGLQAALLHWVRMSEFTADRAGLLACQDPRAASGALMKAAGMPAKYFNRMSVDDFVAQAKEFENSSIDIFDKVAQTLSIVWQDHPWTVLRAAQSYRWIDDGAYDRILRRAISRGAGVSHMSKSVDEPLADADEATPRSMLSPWIQSQLRRFNEQHGSTMYCLTCGTQFSANETQCRVCGQSRGS